MSQDNLGVYNNNSESPIFPQKALVFASLQAYSQSNSHLLKNHPNFLQMGYGDWVQILIQNTSNKTITIKNAWAKCGKFYLDGNKDREVPAPNLDDQSIAGGGLYSVYSCGRENDWAGPEGWFDLYEGDKKLRTITWNCPHLGYNSFFMNNPVDGWVFDQSGGTVEGGALGTVTLKVVHLGN